MYLSGPEVPYRRPLERVREFFTRPGLLSTEQIDRGVRSALAEDIGVSDHPKAARSYHPKSGHLR